MKPSPAIVRILWLITFLLVLIGVAMVIRRTIALFAPSPAPRNFPEAAAMDAGFARHPLLTMLHIIPGLLFMLLGPLQFVSSLRSRRPQLHRWTGRVVIVSGMIIGSTALVMSPQMAIGGANETAATMLFAIVFLFALIKAFLSIRRGNVALHREWMIRAFAIWIGGGDDKTHRGRVFRHSNLDAFDPSRFLWHGFLAGLHHALDCRRDLDQLHQTGGFD